jgi:hypothetical protein
MLAAFARKAAVARNIAMGHDATATQRPPNACWHGPVRADPSSRSPPEAVAPWDTDQFELTLNDPSAFAALVEVVLTGLK